MIATAALPILMAVAAAEHVTAPLAAGDRVRFTRPDTVERTTATVVDSGPGWIVARPAQGGDPVRVPFDSLARLEVARGRRSRAAEGAAIGFIPGAVLGGLLAFGVACLPDAAPREAAGFSPTDRTCNLAGAVLAIGAIGGTATGLVGAAVGAFVKTDRWERVPTVPTRTVTAQISPVRGKEIALAVRIAWR